MKLSGFMIIALVASCLQPGVTYSGMRGAGSGITGSNVLQAAERVLQDTEQELRSLTSVQTSSQCSTFQESKQVAGEFMRGGSYFTTCSSFIRAISSSTSTLKSRLGVVKNTAKVANTAVSKLSSTVTRVYNSANSIGKKLIAIPKIGQIIKIALQVLQTIKTVLASADSLLGKVYALFGKLVTALGTVSLTTKSLAAASSTAGVVMTHSAQVTQLSMACTTKTLICTDDQAVETHNSQLKPLVMSAAAGGAACAQSLGKIANTFQTIVAALKESIFKAIEDAVKKLGEVLQPIMDMVDNAVKEVLAKVNEVYCCTTSKHLQTGLKVIGQVMDLATCPLDGAMAGIESALKLLEGELNKLINQLLSKMLGPLKAVSISYPVIVAGSVDPVQCSIKYPTIATKSVNPFQPWVDAVKDDPPSVKAFTHAVLGIGVEIGKSCSDAANEIGKNLKTDCCIFHKPLSDGKFCDPTNIVPYKKCSQCTSGTNTWWFDRSHVACGKSPCGKDGARCGVGTSCKNCCNPYIYWNKHLFTACGKEPCWSDGKACAVGTTCKRCCNGHSWWASKVFTACGKDPCWADGTRCGIGTSCKKCCSGTQMHWWSRGMTACGNEPCWGGGRRCAAGTSCKRCCNGKRWIGRKFEFFCR